MIGGYLVPKVGKVRYPYTPKGKRAAAVARKKKKVRKKT